MSQRLTWRFALCVSAISAIAPTSIFAQQQLVKATATDEPQRIDSAEISDHAHDLQASFETRRWAEDNLELGYILGMAYIQTRQPDAARRELARTFGVAPESAAANLMAAQMMIRLEFESLAEAELKRALEKDPRLPRVNYLLGQLALFRGRLDEAITLSERELAISPGDAMTWYQLGDAYLRQSRWDEAATALQKSLWINPFYSGPYVLLGRVYVKKGQPATAEGMLRHAIQYDPNNRTAHYLLGQLYERDRRWQDAAAEYKLAHDGVGPK